MRQVTATEAARRVSEVLDAVGHAGETVVVVRGGRAVASIVPVTVGTGRALKDVLRRHRPDRARAREMAQVRTLLEGQERPWPG